MLIKFRLFLHSSIDYGSKKKVIGSSSQELNGCKAAMLYLFLSQVHGAEKKSKTNCEDYG